VRIEAEHGMGDQRSDTTPKDLHQHVWSELVPREFASDRHDQADHGVGGTIGFVGSASYAIATLLITLYGIVIWLDSSSLTAGTAGTAEPSRRGATLAVHSMLGYAGGFVGPLLVGWILDLSGGMSQFGWGMSFFSVAVLMVLALIAFWVIRPRELEGDNSKGR
jgi:MFS family permease